MTLRGIFFTWVCITAYLVVVFLFELWRYRTAYDAAPKPVERKEPPAPAPFTERSRTPPPPDAPRTGHAPQPSADGESELMTWLKDHRKRDPNDDYFVPRSG